MSSRIIFAQGTIPTDEVGTLYAHRGNRPIRWLGSILTNNSKHPVDVCLLIRRADEDDCEMHNIIARETQVDANTTKEALILGGLGIDLDQTHVIRCRATRDGVGIVLVGETL